MKAQEAHLEGQRAELEAQREMLSRNLENVVERFTTSRDDVINQFLALEPLFSATRLRQRESESGPSMAPPRAEERAAEVAGPASRASHASTSKRFPAMTRQAAAGS